MKALVVTAAALGALALGGCESTKNAFDPPKPIDTMTHDELCDYYRFYLTNPNLMPQTRQVATEKMRAKGCPAG